MERCQVKTSAVELIFDVVSLCAEQQVLRIDARSIVAGMPYNVFVFAAPRCNIDRQRSNEMSIGETMGKHHVRLALMPLEYDTVPVVVQCTKPLPAARTFRNGFDILPKLRLIRSHEVHFTSLPPAA